MAFELVRGGPCPNCGAPIQFASAGAAAQVCGSCSFVVARTDRDLRAVGRVGDLVAIKSPFAVGQTGTFEGKRFRIAGRVQYNRVGTSSAPWEELYLELVSSAGPGGWMWLAHAQGQWIATTLYEHPVVHPPFENAFPGSPVQVAGGGAFQISERGERRAISAQGELPFAIDPSQSERFADLSGQAGQYGTIDYGDGSSPPQIYFGRVIDPRAIVLEGGAAIPVEAPSTTMAALKCPGCGGNLPLAAPDLTERIVCRYCSMQCDVNAGALIALKRVPAPSVQPAIALGAQGHLRGRDVTVIGFMVRATNVDDEWYRWREYLLYGGASGFVWLLEEDGRWEFIVPIGLGDIGHANATTRVYQGASYAFTQTVAAVVESVIGEFYWKVEVGETVEATEFAGPQRQKLSEERTSQEVSASHSSPLTLAELGRAFGGAIQHTPAMKDAAARPGLSVFWMVIGALFLLVSITDCASAHRDVVFDQDVLLPSAGTTSAPTTPTTPVTAGSGATGSIDTGAAFSPEFEIKHGNKNLEMIISAPDLQNSWIGTDIALVNTATGTVWEDSAELSYYSGFEDGESWSEGDRDKTLWYSRMPEGKYVLRVEHVADTLGSAPPSLHFKLVSDQPSVGYFVGALGALFVLWLFGNTRRKST
jgi:hypothetical protein